jgi:hypothetical protein
MRWLNQYNIPGTPEHLQQVQAFAKQIPPEKFRELMARGHEIRVNELTFRPPWASCCSWCCAS